MMPRTFDIDQRMYIHIRLVCMITSMREGGREGERAREREREREREKDEKRRERTRATYVLFTVRAVKHSEIAAAIFCVLAKIKRPDTSRSNLVV